MLDEYIICERCAAEKNLDPCDRGNDPAQDYAEEKCVGEGGHFWGRCDEPDDLAPCNGVDCAPGGHCNGDYCTFK